MTEELPQKARKAHQKRSQVAGNLDAILGIKGGSMSNLLQVVNALQADEDEQFDHRMLRNIARASLAALYGHHAPLHVRRNVPHIWSASPKLAKRQ